MIILCCALLVSCTSDGPEGSPGAPPDQATGIPDVSLRQAFPQLERSLIGDAPLLLRPVPGSDNSIAIVDQTGFISTVRDGAKATSAELLVDISDRVRTRGDEEGLLGFAFDPGYSANRHIYVYYSASSPRRTVLSRILLSGAPGAASNFEEQVLLEIPQPFANHNGGMIEFGPDGYLYVGLGDGGSGGDPSGNGQNRGTLLGSLLRIDVSGDAPTYGIPPGNPFTRLDGARPEIWAYGLRNPWRFSFDREAGDLWLGDVGQQNSEEIDLVERGKNYGWNITEGEECFRSATCDNAGLESPVFAYGHALGCSITGGYVYRGKNIPDLRGAYVYADFCSGRIWALRQVDGQAVTQRQIARGPSSISSFGEDAEGELYITTFSEGVLRLAATD